MIGHLNADISFCELGGRLFFLDIQRDRYFQLSETLERAFLHYLQAPDDARIDISELTRYNLLTQISTARAQRPRELDIASPGESVLEMPYLERRIPYHAMRDVFMTVGTMRWQLKAWRLKPILQGLAAYRSSHARPVANTDPEHTQRLAEAANVFNRVRPYVPIETRCLVDSLSMIRFLAGRGFHAQLVMGVTCDPFSAHAWVQHGPLVLNETVGTVQAHVPIRVI
ncbi:lasso peptide biosynthesis B2 protein [Rhodanobacter umsongensis]|uniref:Lasso peptide biosynthesis B2 protein n=1 Tax=Rhodanobacter umsongensis TaxID=633153 RepID=A0ABW0JML4_9GAMM